MTQFGVVGTLSVQRGVRSPGFKGLIEADSSSGISLQGGFRIRGTDPAGVR